MRRNRIAIVLGAMALMAVASCLMGCGFKRQLVSITVIPSTVTITGPSVDVQFKAIGNYIHPPDSRDITNSVAWHSAAPEVVSITAAGLATSGTVCGTNITITATGHSDPHDSSSGIVVGTAAVSVTQTATTPPLC